MCAHYALNDKHVLKMPLKRFWLFSESIDRMKSSDDIRVIGVASAVLSGDAYSSAMERLSDSMGTVVVRDFERDVESIKQLKTIMGA